MGRSGAVPARFRWFGRVSGAHLVVVLAGLLGGVLTLAALRADAREVRVLVAAHDLRVGARLASSDVRAAAVRGDVSQLAALVRDGNRLSIVGRVVNAPLRRGDPLRASDLSAAAAPSRARAISFAVDDADAVDGALSAGDRVDVIAVAHDGKAAGYVLVGAPVLAIGSATSSSGPLHTNDGRVVITLSVAGDDALRLVGALANARVVLVDATGAAPAPRAPRYPLPGAASTMEVAGG